MNAEMHVKTSLLARLGRALLTVSPILTGLQLQKSPKKFQASVTGRRRLRQLVQQGLKEHPKDINLRFAKGRLLFLSRIKSLGTLDAVIADLNGTPPIMVAFRDEVNRHTDIKPFSEFTTSDGRLIRYMGRDKALLPYLVRVLRNPDKALSEDFNYRQGTCSRRDLSGN